MSDQDALQIIRGWKAMAARHGKSPTQLWRDVRDGLFPAPLRLGKNSVGWTVKMYADHLDSLPRVTYAPTPADGPGPAKAA